MGTVKLSMAALLVPGVGTSTMARATMGRLVLSGLTALQLSACGSAEFETSFTESVPEPPVCTDSMPVGVEVIADGHHINGETLT